MTLKTMPGNNRPFPIQVLVVDDSAVVRQVMQAVLSQEPGIAVSVAADPFIAMRKMTQIRPHVVLLDLEMPRMDGLTFLRKIMAEDPIPTLVCSGVAARGTEKALQALDEGALDIVTKPKLGVGTFLHESALLLIDMVKAASQARVRQRAPFPNIHGSHPVAPLPISRPGIAPAPTHAIVAIGASTGGTEALTEILTAMPLDAPGIVVVQHMPEYFTAAFANRLNSLCRIEVKEGAQGDQVLSGRAIIAPGNHHLSVVRRGDCLQIDITDGPLVSRHRPSVDLLFRSVAAGAGIDALGVILTGMGDDGASGMRDIKRAGGATIAQDEETCVVFGMPQKAISTGAVDSIAPLPRIPDLILRWARQGLGRTRTADERLSFLTPR